jgi:hypothetical protein
VTAAARGGSSHPDVAPRAVLTELAHETRPKIPGLIRALDGRFETHCAVHLRQLLDHIDWFENAISTLGDHILESAVTSPDLTTPIGVASGSSPQLAPYGYEVELTPTA